MSLDTRKYALGTQLTVSYPWGLFVSGRALCSDGKVRRLHTIAQTADTFFSVPASVQVSVNGQRKTVSGYITIESLEGSSIPTDNDPAVVKFVAVMTGKNHHLLPGTAWRKVS